MRLFHELDASVLLAISLAAKRRPAALDEVMAAVELIEGFVPTHLRLADSLRRLSSHGLIAAASDALTLSDSGALIVSGQPRKTDTEVRLQRVRQNLAAYRPAADQPAIALGEEQFATALHAHRAAVRAPAKNMLRPPAKTEWDYSRPGPKHRPKRAPSGTRKPKA